MKRIFFAGLLLLLPIRAEAHGCGVACHQIVTTYPVTAGVLYTAEPAVVSYSYVNPQPINVTVNNAPIDSAALAAAIQTGIVNGLSAPPPNQPTPAASPVPSGPPAQAPTQPTPPQPKAAEFKAPAGPSSGLFTENSCVRCHSGGNAKATSAVDMRAPLSCQQKLACIQAIVAGTMPKGAPLSDPNAAGKLITQLSAP